MKTRSLGSSLAITFGVDDEEFAGLNAVWITSSTTDSITGPGAVLSRNGKPFGKEFDPTCFACLPVGTNSLTPTDHEDFVVSDQILAHPADIASIAGRNEVAGIVVQDVSVNMITDQGTFSITSPRTPGYRSSTPATWMSSESDLAIQGIPMDKDGVVLSGKGMPLLLEACISSNHDSPNSIHWTGNTLAQGGQSCLEVLFPSPFQRTRCSSRSPQR